MSFRLCGPVTRFLEEYRKVKLSRILHDGYDLEIAVDALVALTAKGHTRSELLDALRIRWLDKPPPKSADCPCSHDVLVALDFLAGLDLIYPLKTQRGGNALYKAYPSAVDELIYSLEHAGERLPQLPDTKIARRHQAAQDRVATALQNAGWRSRGRTRLRVVG